MIEYYIFGSDRDGKWYPEEHGMTTMCIQLLLVNYKAKYPPVIHVNIDIALDDTHVTTELH